MTLAELLADPQSKKIFLVELNLAEELTDWALTGGQANTYEMSFLEETVTLADDSTETLRKVLSSVEEDGTALTERDSIATVEANAGSYWHDTAAELVYVHPAGGDDPDDHTILGFFWLYFATEGIELEGNYYEPYVPLHGLPAFGQRNPNVHWGATEIGAGTLVLLNGRGFFDQISKTLLWTHKEVRVLLGGTSRWGDELPHSRIASATRRIAPSRMPSPRGMAARPSRIHPRSSPGLNGSAPRAAHGRHEIDDSP